MEAARDRMARTSSSSIASGKRATWPPAASPFAGSPTARSATQRQREKKHEASARASGRAMPSGRSVATSTTERRSPTTFVHSPRQAGTRAQVRSGAPQRSTKHSWAAPIVWFWTAPSERGRTHSMSSPSAYAPRGGLSLLKIQCRPANAVARLLTAAPLLFTAQQASSLPHTSRRVSLAGAIAVWEQSSSFRETMAAMRAATATARPSHDVGCMGRA
mmetsp:Transcript_7807/g.25738  ORF Transcript_7807/g.25738 Transcript_7807/m.25738 type:complete len:218 (-) Transcript_7807:23-676(-)